MAERLLPEKRQVKKAKRACHRRTLINSQPGIRFFSHGARSTNIPGLLLFTCVHSNRQKAQERKDS